MHLLHDILQRSLRGGVADEGLEVLHLLADGVDEAVLQQRVLQQFVSQRLEVVLHPFLQLQVQFGCQPFGVPRQILEVIDIDIVHLLHQSLVGRLGVADDSGGDGICDGGQYVPSAAF